MDCSRARSKGRGRGWDRGEGREWGRGRARGRARGRGNRIHGHSIQVHEGLSLANEGARAAFHAYATSVITLLFEGSPHFTC